MNFVMATGFDTVGSTSTYGWSSPASTSGLVMAGCGERSVFDRLHRQPPVAGDFRVVIFTARIETTLTISR
jgi:hypothetical protein